MRPLCTCPLLNASAALTPAVQAAARQRLGVLRNLAVYQDMPLLKELAEWQLAAHGDGGGSLPLTAG